MRIWGRYGQIIRGAMAVAFANMDMASLASQGPMANTRWVKALFKSMQAGANDNPAVDWLEIRDWLILPRLDGLTREHLLVAGFDKNGRLQYFSEAVGEAASHGGLMPALRSSLANMSIVSVLIAHNHPDGNSRPSVADIAATRQATALCRLAGATIVDHWIVADGIVHSLFGLLPSAAPALSSIAACQHNSATL